jgi:hypothetical protein
VRATRDTIVRAAVQELSASSSVTSLLGADGPNWQGPWIFRWDQHVDVTGSGKAILTVSINGTWATPNRHNTASFPRLQVEVMADASRNSTKLPNNWTPEELAIGVLDAADKLLHRPAGEITWGQFEIVASYRDGETAPAKVPGKDGLVYATNFYGVTV